MDHTDQRHNHHLLVLLDLGGVCFESSGINNAYIDWVTINQLNNIYGHRLNLGEDLFPAFLKDYNRLTHQELEGFEFLKHVFDTLTFNNELVEGIRKHHEIVIVSDNYRENIDYISKRYNFKDWSKEAYYSFDLKMVKSTTGFFEKLLSMMEKRPSACLLIDDSPSKIASAAAAGIKGILYQNIDQTLEALARVRSGK